MHFFILVLIICFLVFLFTLYSLTHDDHFIIRKDIHMEMVFNIAFLVASAGLLFSRLFYVFIYPKPVFFNPLGFLLFPYFPGLSLVGGMLVGGIFLIAYLSYRKMPILKFLDLFSIALLSALPFGFLGELVLLRRLEYSIIFNFLIFLILLLIFIRFIFSLSFRGDLKSGSLCFLFLFSFSLAYLLSKLFAGLQNFPILNFENILLILTLVLSAVFFVKQEFLAKPKTDR